MEFEKTLERLFSRTHPGLAAIAAAALLAGMVETRQWLERQVVDQKQELLHLAKTKEQISVALERFSSLSELKDRDVAQFKAGFTGIAKSRKTLFESGLSLQVERRLLEKQLEIMTTYLMINPSLQRIFLMRGDQPLQSYLIGYLPLRSFPPSQAPAARLPAVVRIISKERFAHPERGTSEMINGRLHYVPPQVGTSVRSNALGEYVMFTNSRLIIHGPPVNEEDHAKFPHVCLGLDLAAARRLYQGSFIGTRVLLNSVAVDESNGSQKTSAP